MWDPKLALFALYNAVYCKKNHDFCHYTDDFATPGQNICTLCLEDAYENDETVTVGFIEHWNSNYLNLDSIEQIENFSKIDLNKEVGPFAQLCHDESYAVGCAMIRTRKRRDGGLHYCHIMVCNYAVRNSFEKPIFKTSNVIRSGCRTKMNEDYPGLCSIEEIRAIQHPEEFPEQGSRAVTIAPLPNKDLEHSSAKSNAKTSDRSLGKKPKRETGCLGRISRLFS